MALVVRLQITAGDHLDDIEVLEVRRLTRLHSRSDSGKANEVHEYVAKRLSPDLYAERAVARYRHRYGDGAWVCVLKALEALRDSALPDDIETTQPGGQ